MAEARNNQDLLDSFSPNQFKAKEKLIDSVNSLGIINSDSEIIILGGWYGSILIPAFKQAKRITLIDMDEKIINIAKNRLFSHYTNVDFISKDVFEWVPDSRRIKTCDLIINTSCEHMKSMKYLDGLNSINAVGGKMGIWLPGIYFPCFAKAASQTIGNRSGFTPA